MSTKLVNSVRAIDKPMGTWWMMRCLLQIDFRTILADHLESLTKYWIEWFRKFKIIICLSDALGYEQLQTLKRISCHRSMINIDRHAAMQPTLNLELRIIRHALDWETSPCEIKISGVDLSSQVFYQLANCPSHTRSCFLIK